MKRSSKHGPIRSASDCPEMTEAIDWFIQRGYRPYRVSEHQLKWRCLSYYPTSGTVRPDDAPSLRTKGLESLERAMCDLLGETSLPVGTEPIPPSDIR